MKYLFFVPLAFFLCGEMYAQDFNLGIKGGVNYSKIVKLEGFENRNTYAFGIFSNVRLGNKLSVQGDLLYADQGGETSSRDFNLTYLNIPIVLKYHIVNHIDIHTGAQLGFLVFDSFAKETNNEFEGAPLDFSGVVGFGYDFSMGIRLEVRHNFGFTDVLKDNKRWIPRNGAPTGGKNAVWALSIGYSFI